MKIKKIQFIFLILLFSILYFFVAHNSVVNSNTSRCYDEANYICEGINLYDFIFVEKSWINDVSNVKHFLALGPICHPSLFHYFQAFSWKILEHMGVWNENYTVLFTNLFFFLILIFSVYRIGVIVHSVRVGVMSSFLLVFFSFVFSSIRIAMLDFPLMSMVALSFFFLLKTKNFKSTKNSILLGFVLGFSQLTKETFFIFVLFPFLYYLCKSCFTGSTKKKILINCFYSLSIYLFLSGIVYFNSMNLDCLGKYFLRATMLNPTNTGAYTAEEYLFFLPQMIGRILFILTFPLFIAGVINIKRWDKMIFLWLIIPIIVCISFPNRVLRFIAPVLPAYALFISLELFTNNFFIKIRKAYVVVLIIGACSQYTILNYFSHLTNIVGPEITFYTYSRTELRELNKYYSVREELLKAFKGEAFNYATRQGNILALFDFGPVTGSLVYKFKMHNLPFKIHLPLENDLIAAKHGSKEYWENFLLNSDYIIDKTGYSNFEGNSHEDIEGIFKDIFQKHRSNFKMIAKIKVQSGDNPVADTSGLSYVFLYKNLSN